METKLTGLDFFQYLILSGGLHLEKNYFEATCSELIQPDKTNIITYSFNVDRDTFTIKDPGNYPTSSNPSESLVAEEIIYCFSYLVEQKVKQAEVVARDSIISLIGLPPSSQKHKCLLDLRNRLEKMAEVVSEDKSYFKYTCIKQSIMFLQGLLKGVIVPVIVINSIKLEGLPNSPALYKDPFANLLSNLIVLEFIHPKTKIEDFINSFLGKSIKAPIIWIGSAGTLVLFVKTMYSYYSERRKVQWEKVTSIYIKPDGARFTTKELINNQKSSDKLMGGKDLIQSVHDFEAAMREISKSN